MKSLKNIVIFAIILIKTTVECVCPAAEIGPCKCYASSAPVHVQLRCGDPGSIQDFTAAALKTGLSNLTAEFDILYIHSTSALANIEAGTFGTANFKKIFIENNLILADINVGAFDAKVQPTTISIRDNPQFKGGQVFELVKKHGDALEYLELNHNLIANIPTNALQGAATKPLQKLKYIRLDNQNPQTPPMTVAANAFSMLPSLLQLSLDHNSIAEIGDATNPAIDLFAVNDATQHVSIFLNNNNIPAEQIVQNRIIELPALGSVGLVLEDNSKPINVATSQKLFVDIVSIPGGIVYLRNGIANTPVCDCSSADIKGISAANKKNIRGVNSCKTAATPVPLEQCT